MSFRKMTTPTPIYDAVEPPWFISEIAKLKAEIDQLRARPTTHSSAMVALKDCQEKLERANAENARLAAGLNQANELLAWIARGKVGCCGTFNVYVAHPAVEDVDRALTTLRDPSAALRDLLGPAERALNLASSVIEAMRKDCLADPGAAIVAEQNCSKQATRLRAAMGKDGANA
jgi:cell division septum initiation protein DivIVA